jgi:hypothetical protein
VGPTEVSKYTGVIMRAGRNFSVSKTSVGGPIISISSGKLEDGCWMAMDNDSIELSLSLN